MTPVYLARYSPGGVDCKQKTPRETENYGEVRWDCTVTNQDAGCSAV